MTSLWHELSPGNWHSDDVNGAPRWLSRLQDSARAYVRAFECRGERIAALLVAPGGRARVNGEAVLGGFRVLTHRDEIVIAGERWFYSAESAPVVTTYQAPEGARPVRCGLCRVALVAGEQVVVCPQCSRCFHEGTTADESEKRCYSYKPQCVCGHPTALNGEAVWRPEVEDADARP